MAKQESLGEKLRALRQGRDLSLRDVEKACGINSGYLSQLESNKITSPTPTMLRKLADVYSVPVKLLMEWAGYIEADPDGTSPHEQRALRYLPDDVSDTELEALKAVLDAMRGGGGTAASYGRASRSDLFLPPDRKLEIRKNAVAVLRELDVSRTDDPVDLDQALAVAELVRAGAIELKPDEKEKLRHRFKGMVDVVLRNLEGVIHTRTGEVYVKEDMHELRERFVLAHEIGHGVLEDHRLILAHLDNRHRLSPDFEDRMEREANQFSIELLAKGDRLRKEFDGSDPSIANVGHLAGKMSISRQATARRVAEESKQEVAVAMAWRRNGCLYPNRFACWASESFDERFGWSRGNRPDAALISALVAANMSEEIAPIRLFDRKGQQVPLRSEGVDAAYSVYVLFAPERRSIFKSIRPRSLNA